MPRIFRAHAIVGASNDQGNRRAAAEAKPRRRASALSDRLGGAPFDCGLVDCLDNAQVPERYAAIQYALGMGR
jgi:hypothetical protein